MASSPKLKKTRLISLLCATVCLFAIANQAAAQVSLRMRSEASHVRTGEPFRVEVRAESTDGRVDSIDVENLSNFQVVGRQQSLSTSFSFGFGSQSKSSQTTVQSLTLIAKQSGEHTLGPAVATLRGKRFESNTLSVNASGEALGESSSGADDPTLQAEGHAFLRVRSDKDEAYPGEQITIDATLYTRDLLAQPLSILKELQIKGAWTHNLLDDPTQVEAQQVSIEGQLYYAYRFKHVAAFALSDAPITVDAMQVEGVSGQRFGLRRRLTPIHAQSEAFTVNTKPLPAGVSRDAAVGRFSLTAKLDRKSVVTGDAVTLSAEVSGEGSLASVSPSLKLAEGLRALDPTTTDDIEVHGGRVGGRKSFKWIIVAERPGNHNVEVHLPTFDPQSGEAKVLRVDDLSFESAGLVTNPNATATTNESDNANATVLPSARVIGDQRARPTELLGQPISILLLLTSIALFIGAALSRMLAKRTRAQAPDPWHEARLHLERAASDPQTAVTDLERALRTSLDAALGQPTASMTLADLRATLQAASAEDSLVDAVVQLQQDLEFARFSPEGGDTNVLIGRTRDTHKLLQQHAKARG